MGASSNYLPDGDLLRRPRNGRRSSRYSCALPALIQRCVWVFSNAPTPVRLVSAEILQHFSIGGAPDFENRAIRIHCGSDHGYVDSAGFRWSSDRFYSGGNIFHSMMLSRLRVRRIRLFTQLAEWVVFTMTFQSLREPMKSAYYLPKRRKVSRTGCGRCHSPSALERRI